MQPLLIYWCLVDYEPSYHQEVKCTQYHKQWGLLISDKTILSVCTTESFLTFQQIDPPRDYNVH